MTSELQKLFNQAVEAQGQRKDIEALAIYKSINAQGFTSAAIELNKSLIFEKKEDWGRALSSLDKAQFLTRRPWLGSENLERIQKQIGSNRAYSIGSLGELTHEIGKVMRPDEGVFLGSLLIGVFFLVKALGFRNRAYFFFVIFAAVFFGYGVLAHFSAPTQYLISDAELRPLPLEESSTKIRVGKGSKVIVHRERGNFVEVSRPGDFAGWVAKAALKEDTKQNGISPSTDLNSSEQNP